MREEIDTLAGVRVDMIENIRRSGLYLFTSNEDVSLQSRCHYIGLASELRKRLVSHFRHNSFLDLQLLGRPIDELKETIFRRLRGAMGKSPRNSKGSTDRSLRKYASDHARNANEKTGHDLFLAKFEGEWANTKDSIEVAETLLITSSWLQGVALTNREISKLGAYPSIEAGFEAAFAAIEAWQKAGLNIAAADTLRKSLIALKGVQQDF